MTNLKIMISSIIVCYIVNYITLHWENKNRLSSINLFCVGCRKLMIAYKAIRNQKSLDIELYRNKNVR